MRKAISAALAGVLTAAPAMADEAWMTQLGFMFWETSRDTMAVLAVEGEDGAVTSRVYLPGLAGDMMAGRGTYQGYWIARPDGATGCGVQLTGPDGWKSPLWGQVTISFVNDAFPSDWAGFYTECFGAERIPLSGLAQVGQ
jgi:hypothetical protein